MEIEGYITELSQHYCVDTCTALQEWQVCTSKQQYTDTDVLATNDTLILSELYLLSKFAQIALTLPVSNADSERAFSRMNTVKTDLYNRLTSSDTRLWISFEGPEQSFTSPELLQSGPLGGMTAGVFITIYMYRLTFPIIGLVI